MSDLKAGIEAAQNAYAAAVNSSNVDAIANCYTDDARVLAPGAPVITGKAGIKEYFAGMAAAGVAKSEFTTVDVGGEGNHAYLVYNSKLYMADGSLFDDGKGLALYYKVGGEWKIFADSANSNKGN